MAIEQEIFEIKEQLERISGSLNIDEKDNKRDPVYLQLTNELYKISEQLIEISKNNLKFLPIQISNSRKPTKNLEESQTGEHDILNAVMENTHAHLAYLDKDLNFLRVNECLHKRMWIFQRSINR